MYYRPLHDHKASNNDDLKSMRRLAKDIFYFSLESDHNTDIYMIIKHLIMI